MLIRFWGVCGSLPSPLRPSRIKEKVSAILEQALPENLADAKSRKNFIEGLPPWLYGAVGGNTPCVSVGLEGYNEPVIFDCGSGIREMGIAYGGGESAPPSYNIFFSHFHWDHIQGFPFFNPAYNQSVTINFYSPDPNLVDALFGQMHPPYFPVEIEYMTAAKNFYLLKEPVSIGPAVVAFRKMGHPGVSYAYKLTCNGKSFIYATDAELSPRDFLQNEENSNFFRNADLIVLDSQYTMGEAIEKYHWGHSSANMSVDFASHWGIKHLVLFHHDPAHDDETLYGMLQSARWYTQQKNIENLEISLAVEGQEILL